MLDELDEASLAAQRRLTIPFIRDALEKHARNKTIAQNQPKTSNRLSDAHPSRGGIHQELGEGENK